MRYFTLCLYTEGPSDRYFLEKIIWRALIGLLAEARDSSEVQEQFVRFSKKPKGTRRKDYIVSQVKNLEKEITIAFVHGDGGNDPKSALTNNCLPATDAINKTYENICGIPVVPVREMEAWALADQNAIREVTGIRDYVSPSKDVEKIEDPKAVIKEILGRSRILTVDVLLNALADAADFRELRKLASYASFEADLKNQLVRTAVL